MGRREDGEREYERAYRELGRMKRYQWDKRKYVGLILAIAGAVWFRLVME